MLPANRIRILLRLDAAEALRSRWAVISSLLYLSLAAFFVLSGLRESALLGFISSGDFCLNGLRNRDLQARLFAAPPSDPREAKRRSAKLTRWIRLLRAHGLLRKVPHTHRYLVTESGRKALTAIATARRATVAQLSALAA